MKTSTKLWLCLWTYVLLGLSFLFNIVVLITKAPRPWSTISIVSALLLTVASFYNLENAEAKIKLKLGMKDE